MPNTNKTPITTVLFDLDGTFADTARDLALALNFTLQQAGKDELPFEQIRPHVSHGSTALIQLGFPELAPGVGEQGVGEQESEAFVAQRQVLLDFYADNIASHTTLFDEIPALLDSIQQQHMYWGIVTNKPAWLTEPLLENLTISIPAKCVVSGDTLPQRKPDPEPLLHACEICGCKPEETIYVGDAERDIVAGKRAGMHSLIALYGYIGEQDNPAKWQADAMVNSPIEIAQWIEDHNLACRNI